VLQAANGATCFAVTVLTGAPILDAMEASRKVKMLYPVMPIIWGGWHPSLFPEQTLLQSHADIVVKGQGEITFAELLHRIVNHQSLQGLYGISFKENGNVSHNPERHLTDINAFPAFNFDLIDVNAYKKLSGRQQLDYISSQGCRFRCHFCADPAMYNRSWFGYSPARIANEIAHWKQRYNFNHVHFQDETFFTSSKRVAGVAEEFIKRNLKVSWFATMRADQGCRIDDKLFALCKESGLERVMIGVESGSQQMLDWMKKDIRIEQVFEVAERCHKHDIAINFSMIVGFPGETEENMNETLLVAKGLRKMSPEFRASIFYFKPYPGNPIADMLLKDGYLFPQTLHEWALFDYVGPVKNEWITPLKF
jgi:radical SAM superfamily enzyme YgiQ (UPF0313 family)